jgi:hypothetical protein
MSDLPTQEAVDSLFLGTKGSMVTMSSEGETLGNYRWHLRGHCTGQPCGDSTLEYKQGFSM